MDSLAQKKEQLENDLASTHRQNFDEMERTNSLQAENDVSTNLLLRVCYNSVISINYFSHCMGCLRLLRDTRRS